MAKPTAGQHLRAKILAFLDEEKIDPDEVELEMLDRAAAAADHIETSRSARPTLSSSAGWEPI